ncbi:transcriptional regulator family: Fungal Specific TF [Paecilomyces variotii]|nr:transcriptional regulator family: Fungal Specific TF [Paecilomyces variotii]
MEHSYLPPGASLPGYSAEASLAQLNDSSQIPFYAIFAPATYPESVAFWHDPPVQQHGMSAFGGLPMSTPQPAQSAVDQKKHKRTRSGCFTCRSRRVKCDETRPVCERCRKGKRECVYPPPPSQKSGSRAGTRSTSQGDSSDNNEGDDASGLETIQDEEGSEQSGRTSSTISTTKHRPAVSKTRSAHSIAKRKIKQTPDSSTLSKEKSLSPFTDTATRSESHSPASNTPSVGFDPLYGQEISNLPETAQLPDDILFFLDYHQKEITHHHYMLKSRSGEFIHRTIVELCLKYEPLLYAVVGFSAYHYCLRQPGGKLYTFLRYYNKSLILLRKSLASAEPHSEATLITILLLTTFEEFTGDWVNLVDHHQAAHTLILELLTPETANENELHRHIFVWYARFDLVAGLLAGNETILTREWYTSREEYDAKEAAEDPSDVQKQLSLFNSRNRRFAMDMASLYAKLSRGMIPMDQFVAQNEQLSLTKEELRTLLTQFDTSEHTVTSYPHRVPLTENDIVDPYMPGRFFEGPLWDVNFSWIDFLATSLMFQYQSSLVLRQESSSELQHSALEQCRLIETIERWPEKENGTVIAFHSSLGLASMFIPKDARHTMWIRRKLARAEQDGYIYPPKFRMSMAQIWGIPEVKHWWLPNDEGYPDIVREIRKMTEERTTNPRDNFREDVREMKTLFGKMNVDDSPI